MYRREINNSSVIESLKETLDCGIPAFIEDDIVNLSCKNKEIVCDICNKSLNIVLDNKTETTKNFKAHFLEDHHISKQNVSDNDNLKRIQVEFDKVNPRKPLPQIVYVNQLFLKDNGKDYECKLCNKILPFPCQDIPYIENYFCCHLLSNDHIEKVKAFYDKYHEVKIELEKIYDIVHPVILDNIEFITKNDSNYFCDLCKIHLSVDSTNVHLTLEQFKMHLQSSDHKKKAEQEKAFQKVPKLKEVFCNQLPNYIVRNIEYINYQNSECYFCSLCNECIPIKFNWIFNETEHNFKYHLLSPNHIENLLIKRDPKNDVYKRLHLLFETFPICVKKYVQSLGRNEGDFYCHTCKCKIKNKNDDKYTAKNTLSHFVPGYGNLSIHKPVNDEHLALKTVMSSNVLQSLKCIFGSMSKLIQENIKYLQMCSENHNILCFICDVKLPFFKNNPDTTSKEIEKHLSGKKHEYQLNNIENQQTKLKSALLEQFTPFSYGPPSAHLVNPVPRLIENHYYCVSYKDTSKESDYNYQSNLYDDDSSDDDIDYCKNRSKTIESERVSGNNYFCEVCCKYNSPKVILAGKPRRYSPDDFDDLTRNMTEYNFRTHVLSQEHKLNIQRDAFNVLTTQQKFESFGTIPTCVYNNIEHMSVKKFLDMIEIYCTLCEPIKILSTTQISQTKYNDVQSCIKDHFIGREFDSQKVHQDRQKCIEDSNNLAMEILDMRFRKVPEIVVKNIDFLEISGPNIFCVLCQETLYIDEYDLEQTEYDLSIHMRSRKHIVSLNE